MAKKKAKKKSVKEVCKSSTCSCGGGIYCGGFLGALIYYISTATGFWVGVLGVLKAIIWPVLLVYSLMKSLGM